jgi:hypothetical protein
MGSANISFNRQFLKRTLDTKLRQTLVLKFYGISYDIEFNVRYM